MSKIKNIVKALFFIVLAVCLIGGELDYFEGLNIWRIGFILMFSYSVIQAIYYKSFSSACFSVAALYYVVQSLVDVPKLSVWVLFISSILFSMALSHLFPNNYKYKKKCKYSYEYEGNEKTSGSNYDYSSDGFEGENKVYVGVNLGSAEKYISSNKFESCEAHCNFGELKIYFDAASMDSANGNLYVELNFGEVDVYVPRNWRVETSVSSAFASVNFKGTESSDKNKLLKISGSVHFGELNIIYI